VRCRGVCPWVAAAIRVPAGDAQCRNERTILMAESSANFNQRFKDLIATFADADSSQASARIVASGESTSVKLNMTASRSDDGALAILSASTEVETDGSTLLVTGDAAASGETASASFDLSARLQDKVAEALAIAEAEAEGEGSVASASTSADVSPGFVIVAFDQETIETNGNDPTATSLTSLEAVWTNPTEPNDSATGATGDGDWLL
jgi:hypothetical protein